MGHYPGNAACTDRSLLLGCRSVMGAAMSTAPSHQATKCTWKGAGAFRHNIQMLMNMCVILGASNLKCLSPELSRFPVPVSFRFRDHSLSLLAEPLSFRNVKSEWGSPVLLSAFGLQQCAQFPDPSPVLHFNLDTCSFLVAVSSSLTVPMFGPVFSQLFSASHCPGTRELLQAVSLYIYGGLLGVVFSLYNCTD